MSTTCRSQDCLGTSTAILGELQIVIHDLFYPSKRELRSITSTSTDVRSSQETCTFCSAEQCLNSRDKFCEEYTHISGCYSSIGRVACAVGGSANLACTGSLCRQREADDTYVWCNSSSSTSYHVRHRSARWRYKRQVYNQMRPEHQDTALSICKYYKFDLCTSRVGTELVAKNVACCTTLVTAIGESSVCVSLA